MKKIIIIGATSGIGLEVARCYLKAGWQVGVAGRREEELEKLRQSAPGQVCTQRIDVTREEGFYAKSESPSPQAVPAAGEPTISMTALLELLKDADPEVKAQLRLALLT